MLTAQYISLYHRDIPITAVYTFGSPVSENTLFSDYMATCINAEKIVRVMSAIDIVPLLNNGRTKISKYGGFCT
jgi:hypothetical protein